MANKGGILLGLGALVGGVFFLTRKKKDGGGDGDNLSLVIIPAGISSMIGAEIGAMPSSLQAGSKGNIARLTVTNTTVYTGTTVLAPYTFKVHGAVWSGAPIFLSISQDLSMAPGETQTLDFLFDVPITATGQYQATAFLNQTNDVNPASPQVNMRGNITSAAVTPSGTVTF